MLDSNQDGISLSDNNSLLSEAIIYLDKAITALKSIQRIEIPELRTFTCPPAVVNEVFKAIWFLEGKTDDFNWRLAMNELTMKKVNNLIETSKNFRLNDDINFKKF
ncbi:hypothetical protein SteCoe_37258 [Stentor coeruleus]|uniref:Uncharacterized protein n=1 Tax=Stentor coeruleus TaxID=5963 RepID=A0A1R2ANF0_9CILI|nr:hypothetical protein SteCoe_37258 [Stentor coeruleus]